MFSMLIFQREITEPFATPEAGFDASFCPEIVSQRGRRSDSRACQLLCLALSLLSVTVKALLEIKVLN